MSKNEIELLIKKSIPDAKIIIEVPLKKETRFNLGEVNIKELENSLNQLELGSLVRQIPLFNATFSSGGLNANNPKPEGSKTPYKMPQEEKAEV